MFRKLIAHQLRLWWAFGTRGRRKGTGYRLVASLLGLGAFAVFAHFGAYGFFNMVERNRAGSATQYLPAVFAMVGAVGLIPILTITLSELYLRSDLDLMMASPLKIEGLFVTKLAGLVIASSGMVGFFFLSVLSGYGRALDASAVFYLATVFLVVILSILLSAIDMSLVMLLARIMPAKRIQGLVIVLSGAVGATFWLMIQFISRRTDASPPGTPFAFPAPPQLRGLITSYPARALSAIQASDGLSFVYQTSVFLVLTLGLAFITYWIFRVTFYEGNARVRAAPISRSVSSRPRLRERLGRVFPQPIRGLVIKDWLSLPRDLRYLSTLLTPLVMVVFLTVRAFSPTGVPSLWASVAPVGLLCLFVATGTALPSIGMEGRNFALLRSLPISVDQIMIGKFAAFGPVVLMITLTALVPLALWRGVSPFLLASMAVVSVWLSAGVTALAVGVGALGAKFDADSAQKAVSPGSSVIAVVVGILFVISNGGMLYWVAAGSRGGGSYWQILLVATGAALATTGLIAFLVLAGRRHLHRVET